MGASSSSSSGGADEGQWSIRATSGATAPRLASAAPTSVSGQVCSQATLMYWLMYWLLCIMVLMDTAYTSQPCHAACHEIAQVLSACHPSTMQLDRSVHSFEVLHLMRRMDTQSLHTRSTGNSQSLHGWCTGNSEFLHGWSTGNSKRCCVLVGVW